jgi:small-conductance mechanosensitive channel
MKEKSNGIGDFFEQLAEVTRLLKEQFINVAPEVMQILLSTVQLKGIFSLCIGFILLILLLPIKSLFKKMWKASKDEYAEMGVVLFGFIFGLLYLLIVVYTLRFSSWLAAFYPEGALALKAIEAVGVNL